MFESLFKEQIQKIIAGEGELLEKALLGGKALIDYGLLQLNGFSITVTINTQPVKKAESAEHE